MISQIPHYNHIPICCFPCLSKWTAEVNGSQGSDNAGRSFSYRENNADVRNTSLLKIKTDISKASSVPQSCCQGPSQRKLIEAMGFSLSNFTFVCMCMREEGIHACVRQCACEKMWKEERCELVHMWANRAKFSTFLSPYFLAGIYLFVKSKATLAYIYDI